MFVIGNPINYFMLEIVEILNFKYWIISLLQEIAV